jgi:D-lactate dehydrogenase
LRAAAAAVSPFVEHGAAVVEHSDRASVRGVEGKPGVPDRWRSLPETATSLLVKFRESSSERLAQAERAANEILAGLTLLEPADFAKDPHIAAQLWTVSLGCADSGEFYPKTEIRSPDFLVFS